MAVSADGLAWEKLGRDLIAERLGDRHGPTFSFEYFPPQDATGAFTLLDTVANLRELRPDWVSVTYGATGATRQRTFDAVRAIMEREILVRAIMAVSLFSRWQRAGARVVAQACPPRADAGVDRSGQPSVDPGSPDRRTGGSVADSIDSPA